MQALAGDVPSKAMAIGVGMFASVGGFLFGYDTGYIAGVKAMGYFIREFGERRADGTYYISTSTDSLITSILSLGTFFGAIASAWIGGIFGRKIGIWIYLVLFAAGVAMQTGAKDVPLFSVGRVFAGLGVGGVSCLVPIFQAETAPQAWRGAIVSAYQLMITIGLLIAAVIVNATKDNDTAFSYQLPIGLQFTWGAVLAAGLFFLPESPRWLMVKGREEDARRALARLQRLPIDSPSVSDELANIASNIHHERSIGGDVSFLDMLFKSTSSRLPLRVWTGAALQALQQLSGINFIFYYGTTFFKNSGISNPFLITIATNVVNVGMTLPGMWAVDKLGRRQTMIWGAVGMAVCQLIVAITGTAVSTGNEAGQKVLVAFVCIYIAFFAAIWGPFAWVITSEIVPNSVRSKSMAVTTGTQWLFNFGIGYATPYLVDEGAGRAGLGSKVFFIWGGCCVVATVFAWALIPETKGLSLEQIDLMYRNATVRQSPAYRRRILSENMQDEDKAAYVGAMDKGSASHNENIEKRDFESA